MKRALFLAVLLVGCDKPSPSTAPSGSTSAPAPSASSGGQCAIEPCHGVDLKCSAIREPVMCTELYAVGDFCRQFAACERKDGACAMVKNAKLDECASCIKACADAGMDCDKQCRAKLGVP